MKASQSDKKAKTTIPKNKSHALNCMVTLKFKIIKGNKTKPAIKSWIEVKAKALPLVLKNNLATDLESANNRPEHNANINQFIIYFLDNFKFSKPEFANREFI